MNLKLTRAVLIGTLAVAGCQSNGEGGYSETVQGDYVAIASCFAQQPIEVSNEERTGNVSGLAIGQGGSVDESQGRIVRARPPSLRQVTVNDAAARKIVVEVGTATAGGYRVTFTGLADKTTEVRARAIGFPARYFWPNEVAPLVARCSGRIPS